MRFFRNPNTTVAILAIYTAAAYAYLMPRNLVWVLASWQIEIKRMPALNERVVIGTLPMILKGFWAPVILL